MCCCCCSCAATRLLLLTLLAPSARSRSPMAHDDSCCLDPCCAFCTVVHEDEGRSFEPSCPVCTMPYDASSRRPVDLGCGHLACDRCIASCPRSFK